MAQHYLEKMNDENVDLIIFPASLVPAPKRVRINLTNYNGSHTYNIACVFVISENDLCFAINFQDYQFYSKVPMSMVSYIAWNLFDFPAGILPVSKVTQDDENKFVTSFTNNDLVRSNITAKNECLLVFPQKILNWQLLHFGKHLQTKSWPKYYFAFCLDPNRFTSIVREHVVTQSVFLLQYKLSAAVLMKS